MAPPPAVLASPADPHAIATSFGRLGTGSRKAARVSMGIASALLEPGEVVECVIAGRINELDGVAVLTDRRLLIANERQWVPDQVSFPLDAALVVQGIAEGHVATLRIQRENVYAEVARITDVALAQELAQRIRARAAGYPPASAP